MHGEVLIGSTTERAGFDVSVTQDAISSRCRGAIRAVPMLRNVGVKRVWAGLRPGTPDELPILGAVDGVTGIINATGGFRTGIVASPLAAESVAQAITGEELSVPIDSFLASRFNSAPA
jgi:hydrogen cyanide synthase HcnC